MKQIVPSPLTQFRALCFVLNPLWRRYTEVGGWLMQPVTRSKLRCWMLESSWNVMAPGDAREGKWRGNWRMEWVAITLHTTSEHGVSSITTAVAYTSTASSRLNWRPRRFKWTRPFRGKTKSGFCACAITFQTRSTPSRWCSADAAVIPRLTSDPAKEFFG